MANKIKIKATKDDFEAGSQDQGDFEVPPNGYYILQLKEANPGYSKKKDSDEVDKTKPRIECIWAITGVGVEDEEVTANYGNVWDYVSFSEASGFSRGRFLRALGYSDGLSDFDGEIDLDEAIGKKVLARLRQQRGQNKDDPKRAKIGSLLPYEDRNMADAFGAAEEDELPDDAAADAAEDYTQEELEGQDLKALGALAKEEFGLNPKDSVVQVRGKTNNDKTKAKIIEAILAAQADASGDTDDGEDPF